MLQLRANATPSTDTPISGAKPSAAQLPSSSCRVRTSHRLINEPLAEDETTDKRTNPHALSLRRRQGKHPAEDNDDLRSILFSYRSALSSLERPARERSTPLERCTAEEDIEEGQR